MSIDVSTFYVHNIADTCAVWNVLSSRRLFRAAVSAGVAFTCTRVVIYECLHKPRKSSSIADRELQARLQAAQRAAEVAVYPIDIDDLQGIVMLENRRRLGKGELSTIAFAIKTQQVVLTDDQKARRLVMEVMARPAQTTPHMVGWLFFNRGLTDSDKDIVISEHNAMERPLGKYFELAYVEACRCRLMGGLRNNAP